MINVAIDGPAGAGKSTIAKAVAKKLGYIYVDTGALYRAIAYYTQKNNVNFVEVDDYLKFINIEIVFDNSEQKIFLNSENITNKIRTEEISMLTSKISAQKSVRNFLLFTQRDIAAKNNVIMDGRDIASVVLPNAQVKIFLTASAETRAHRRFLELTEKGSHHTYDEILKDIISRDLNDISRKIAPLKRSNDAILIDTSDFTLEQAINAVYSTVVGCINKQNF